MFQRKISLLTFRNTVITIILKTRGWSVAPYGSELWTIGVTEEKKPLAFEARGATAVGS